MQSNTNQSHTHETVARKQPTSEISITTSRRSEIMTARAKKLTELSVTAAMAAPRFIEEWSTTDKSTPINDFIKVRVQQAIDDGMREAEAKGEIPPEP